jgi:hypothetical protein
MRLLGTMKGIRSGLDGKAGTEVPVAEEKFGGRKNVPQGIPSGGWKAAMSVAIPFCPCYNCI